MAFQGIFRTKVNQSQTSTVCDGLIIVYYYNLWDVGGTVVVHLSLTLVTCEKSDVQFDSTKRRRFSPGTPVSSCSNTGPMRGGLTGPLGRTAQVADRVIQYK